MEFKNYMEELVTAAAGEILPKQENICKCQRCRLDILALALNSLPQKYAVTDVGRAYNKLETLKTQFQADVARELALAMEKVKNSPRH